MADAHPKFDVALVTPDGAVFDGEAEMIVVPGAVGEIGVLARHAPLVATLKAGSTRIHPGGNEESEVAAGRALFNGELARALAASVQAGKAEREKAGAGEFFGGRGQIDQPFSHAENQLAVSGRTTG